MQRPASGCLSGFGAAVSRGAFCFAEIAHPSLAGPKGERAGQEEHRAYSPRISEEILGSEALKFLQGSKNLVPPVPLFLPKARHSSCEHFPQSRKHPGKPPPQTRTDTRKPAAAIPPQPSPALAQFLLGTDC